MQEVLPQLALPQLLGFGFGSTVMLWFLTAGTAPLIIHLWNKRHHREETWAAMEYLLAAIKKDSRRILIEQWVLLALRTLLILLLALAVAEPFMEQVGVAFVPGRRTHKVLVIDGSYSMGYRPGDRSRFERAKQLAAQIVDESTQGDGFTLILMADPPRTVVSTPAFAHIDFLDEIENLKLTHGGANLAGSLQAVEAVLKRARDDHPKLAQEEIYFFTDLGRTTWAPDFSGATAQSEFLERAKRLGETALLAVIDLGQEDAGNLAIDSIEISESFATTSKDVIVSGNVRSFSRQPHDDQMVELFVDGRRAGEQRVDLEAGGQQSVAFNYRFDSPGPHGVELRLMPDRLDLDNHRWLALDVKQQLRVLAINGKPSGRPFQGATDYLEVALAASPDGQAPGVVAEVATETALSERRLQGYDAIFLCNVGQFSPGEAQQLREYVLGGGGLVVFLGDQVQPDSYNRQLAAAGDRKAPLLPAELGELVTQNNQELNALDYRHPIVAPFADNESTGLLKTPIYKYFKLHLPKEDEAGKSQPTANVALAFANGDPLIVEKALGAGRVILLATSAEVGPGGNEWTLMPMLHNYLPLVHELLAAALSGQLKQTNVEVGETIGAELPVAAAGESRMTVETPAGGEASVRIETGTSSPGDNSDFDGSPHWFFTETTDSGLYRVSTPQVDAPAELFAVNLNTVESNLARLTVDELREDLWPGVPVVHRTTWQNLEERPAIEISQRNFWHRWLLEGVLALLFAELALAWWLGRRKYRTARAAT